ncbi:CDP-alcohol phosphatidyltransferase family protein [Geodermatophilus ruber]|uniref:Phosphatidylglycerophosphate synthase n=1 Tax=Geodermatophilus ruber TaxID=504800 RepID=A0A1I4JXU6_9ACTN|nr:CDP-alcohol phosphatidyltransferase family protein [Geodermatophilus ruber]SFL71399.1 Phosphatidylglycerophosphate synthase [Geodermatophilus ruber]
MRTIRLEMILGALTTPALLGILSVTVGLDVAGWLIGLAAGWAVTALLAVGRVRSEQPAILPPDWVTLTRALLTAAVAGLVAGSVDRPARVTMLVALASVALALDALDGRLARRTGTATPFGARFDGEVDAFLILVLSVAVSRDYGGWVLAIGAARYALLVAGWAVPWLAAPLPPRYWGKVVAAVQGIVLTAAVSGVLPRPVGMIAVGAALLLLAESFGRSVIWLYRSGAGPRTRRALRGATALVAAAVVWAVLVAPDRLDRLTPAAFARIPVEGLALVAIGLLLPPRPRRVVAATAGVAFGLLTILKILDAGFHEQLGRPFDLVLDWGNLAPAIGVVRDSIGAAATDVLLVLVGLALAVLVAVVTASAVRVSTVTARHRRGSARGIATLGVVWAVCAALSLQLAPGAPIASTSTADLAVAHGRAVEGAVRDQQRFAAASHSADPYADLPASDLLTGLRGKDVIVAFVESYGQVALRGASFSPGVTAVLRSGTHQLAEAGYSARSAYLDSPTFGGASWLAHATLQSGLWIDSQQRYDQLMASDRFTLSVAFGQAGWRTVGVNPANDGGWPHGTSFYHFDQLYDRHGLGYQGPAFSWATMPDQYTLAAFQRLELAPGHRPVMAEIDLVSSHTPWTPLPTMVPWDQVGDGSIFDPMPAQGPSPDVAWRDPETVRRLYGESIQYSLRALISWVTTLNDDDLVLVLLGDHQPATTVSGPEANHQVPISVVAHDPAVLSRIASWHWQDGLLPSPTAPVWPMDAFRNRFLEAFSTASLALPIRPPR